MSTIAELNNLVYRGVKGSPLTWAEGDENLRIISRSIVDVSVSGSGGTGSFANSGSFATTASNFFKGDQTISGSIYMTGSGNIYMNNPAYGVLNFAVYEGGSGSVYHTISDNAGTLELYSPSDINLLADGGDVSVDASL
jgi:hypothetical protein